MLTIAWLDLVRRRLRHSAALLRGRRRSRKRRLPLSVIGLIEKLEDRTLLAAPMAYPDSYDATLDTLDTAAQGLASVLDNDYDADGDPLTARLASDATYGSVTLASDGHFVYTFPLGWTGSDSFSYVANDGTSDSYPQTVSINVVKPFGDQANQPDLPFAGVDRQGTWGTSMQTGDLQTAQPVAPGHALVYSSLSQSHPIVVVDTSFTGSTAPDKTEVRLTLGGVAGDPVWYSGSVRQGESVRFALQADASTLSTGRYHFEMRIIAHYGSNTSTRFYTGQQHVIKATPLEFGHGWNLAGLDRLEVDASGVLYLGGDGRAAWFGDNGDGTFSSPPGPLAFSTLTLSAGVYTLTDKYGNTAEFDSSGLLTAWEDRNSNRTTYAYIDADGDTLADEISQITDPFGRSTATFTYTGGLVSSVEDLAGRVTMLSHNAAGQLVTIARPDPDAAGSQTPPQTQYAYASGTNRLSQITDALSNTWQVQYDFAGRIDEVTNPDATNRQFDPFQVVGLVDTSTSGSEASPAPYYRLSAYSASTDETGQTTSLKLDRFGYVTESRNPLGHTTLYQRDGNGLVTKLTAPDPDGTGSQTSPITTFSYDANGNLTGTTLPDGSARAWVYDTSVNRPTSYTDELWRETIYSYDTNGNRLTEQNPAGETTTYTYTAHGQVDTVASPDPDDTGPLLPATVDNGYDSYGRLVTITQPDAATRTFTYDTADNLLTETDELGRTWSHTYDALDRRTTTTSPDPDSTGPLAPVEYDYVYNGLGWLTRESVTTSGMTGTIETDYAHNWRGQLTQTTLPDPDGGGAAGRPTLQNGYDSAGRRTSTTDQRGNVTTFSFDAASRLTTITLSDPDGAGQLESPVERRSYDNMDRLTSVQDPRGYATQLQYDSRSRKVQRTDALGGTYQWVWDAASQLTSETDELGRITDYEYDLAGRRTKRILNDPDDGGSATRPEYATGYDKMGRVVTQTDPSGRTVTLEYNSRSWLVRQTEPDPGTGSPVHQWTYSNAGEVLTYVDPMNRTTTNEWNNLGQLVEVTDNLNHSTQYRYDVLGNRTHVIDALGHETVTNHDNLSRPVKITDAIAGVTWMAWDPAGNMTSLTDPVGNTTSWAYDNLNRPTSETNALNASRTFQYDAASNVTAIVDRNGRERQFTFDALNRRTEERWLDSDGTTLLRTISFAFDAASQMTSASDVDSAHASTYDGLGRVTEVDNYGTPNVPNVVLTSGYDALGNRTSLAATVDTVADFQNAYTFDALSRITRIEQTDAAPLAGLAVAEKRIDLAYNAAGQFSTITRYEDLAGTALVAESAYGYDGAGKLTSLDHKKGATVLASYTWMFDAANRITQFVSPDGTSDYSYDDTNQLTAASLTSEAYVYDANGNRTNTGYQTGTGNRLLSGGAYDYQYDAEGNRTRKTHKTTSESVDYQWDHRNRLKRVEFRDAQGVLTKAIEYTYDLFDRLIGREVDDTGNGVFDRSEWIVYDGGDIALVHDGAGSLKNRFAHGPEVDQVFVSEDALGAILWPLADNQQTVRDIADYDPASDTTSIANHREFDSFGRMTAESNAAVDFLFAWTGRFWDEDTGQQNNRRRWYDAPTGRFLSEDPSGLGPDSNPFRYVHNSPANFIDPDGRAARRPGDGRQGRYRQMVSAYVQYLRTGDVTAYAQAQREFGESTIPSWWPHWVEWIADQGAPDSPDDWDALLADLRRREETWARELLESMEDMGEYVAWGLAERGVEVAAGPIAGNIVDAAGDVIARARRRMPRRRPILNWPRHGDEWHNDFGRRQARELEERYRDSVRWNQDLVDASGNRIPGARPDIQYVDGGRVHIRRFRAPRSRMSTCGTYDVGTEDS